MIQCRRKKIRCDATFSTTSNSVVNPCTSCIKNKENCSFERVPLKRGPTKGYTKDGGNESRERSKSSVSSTRTSSSMGNQSLPSHHHHQQPQSSSSPITLPPLVSLTNNVPFRNYSASTGSTGGTSPNTSLKDSNDLSQPTSPRRGSGFGHNQNAPNSSSSTTASSAAQTQAQAQAQANPNGSVPQGLFWKVPYSQGPFDRRGSVDSVSSSLSERSPRFSSTSSVTGGGNFVFGQRPISYESSVVSDSDDDRGSNYSPRASVDIRSNRSRSNSANLQVPTSPALSISSLNSLNQGFNKNLNIQNSNMVLVQQQQNQMIELYYQFIHPSFPILPLNKQSLGNLLAIPGPNAAENSNEIHEINSLIVQSFYASLDVLMTVTTRGSRSPSIISLPNVQHQNINANPVEIINHIFKNVLKIFPQFQAKFNSYSQNIVILLASSLVILSYAITLLGFESDVYISSSISIFNKLKIFRLFWNPSHSVTSDNYDDYNSILKRLYIDLYIIDTLQSLSFGIPKALTVDYNPSIIDQLFPNFNGISGMDFDVTKNNLKFGIILSKISYSRDFANPRAGTAFSNDILKNKYNYFHNVINRDLKQDQIAANLLDTVISKFELIGFLDEVSQSFQDETRIDEELVYDYQLKSLRVVKKHLELESNLLRSIKNYTNSIETNSLVSPFLPLVFRQSIKILNIQKMIINSLQINKDLVTRLSKPLNDLISLNNYLSLLKPFKNDEFNNHMKFNFVSEHLKFLEYADNNSNEQAKEVENFKHWIGLMRDIKDFVQRDDYDGWL